MPADRRLSAAPAQAVQRALTHRLQTSERLMNRQEQRRNLPVWFEIPVSDMPRAVRFYETLFQSTLIRESAGPLRPATLSPRRDEGGTTGCVAQGGFLKPGQEGPVVYLNAAPQLDKALERVQAAGGE